MGASDRDRVFIFLRALCMGANELDSSFTCRAPPLVRQACPLRFWLHPARGALGGGGAGGQGRPCLGMGRDHRRQLWWVRRGGLCGPVPGEILNDVYRYHAP